MGFLGRHIDGIMLMDKPSLLLLAVICAIAAYFIKDYLANPLLAILVYPLLLLFSVVAQYIIGQSDVYSPKKLDQWLMWTILASIVGNVIGMGLVACIVTLRDRSSRARMSGERA
jgi:hypothetical protein